MGALLLDRRIYGDDARQVVPLRRLLAALPSPPRHRLLGDAPGAVGVSLLTR